MTILFFTRREHAASGPGGVAAELARFVANLSVRELAFLDFWRRFWAGCLVPLGVFCGAARGIGAIRALNGNLCFLLLLS